MDRKPRSRPSTSTLVASAAVLVLALVYGCSRAVRDNPSTPSSRGGEAGPAAQATASPSSLSQQQFTPVGRLSLSPDHGPWGTRVTATSAGLEPGAGYDLVWTSVDGAWKLSADRTAYEGRQYRPVQRTLASGRAGDDGVFTATFDVPNDFGFQHDVFVVWQGRPQNKAGFDVDLQVSVSPASGPPGTPITIEARGIGWQQLENSWLVSYDNKFTGWLSAVTTHGLARAVIPATGGPGVHVVTVLHGDFTFPYLNMQQSPEPDRPQFHLNFTVTGGPAVLPPPVAAQLMPTSTASAPSGDGPALWLDPPDGIVGSAATVHARGLPPNADVDLAWATVVGNRVSGSGWEEQAKAIGQARTDASGALAWQLTVPDDLGGLHTVSARAGGRTLAGGTFTIRPSAALLSVTSGPPGTEVLVQLHGVGWTETANIYNIVYDNAYAGYACGFNSGGNVQVFLRMSGAPGWHFIDLYPGIYKGKETRPINFRIPQLTYAADHPGERLPAFHFAFYITAPGQ